MALVRIYHPDLDRWAEVPAPAVRLFKRVGWTDDRLAEIVKLSQDAGLYDDIDVDPAPFVAAVEHLAPAAPVAHRPVDEPHGPAGADPTPHEED